MDTTRPAPQGMILLGRVHGAFGIRGELKLESFTDPATAIFRYQDFFAGRSLLEDRATFNNQFTFRGGCFPSPTGSRCRSRMKGGRRGFSDRLPPKRDVWPALRRVPNSRSMA